MKETSKLICDLLDDINIAIALLYLLTSIAKSSSSTTPKIHCLYIISDVVFRMHRERNESLLNSIINSISPILIDILNFSDDPNPASTKASVDKVLNLWRDKSIFDPLKLAKVRADLIVRKTDLSKLPIILTNSDKENNHSLGSSINAENLAKTQLPTTDSSKAKPAIQALDSKKNQISDLNSNTKKSLNDLSPASAISSNKNQDMGPIDPLNTSNYPHIGNPENTIIKNSTNIHCETLNNNSSGQTNTKIITQSQHLSTLPEQRDASIETSTNSLNQKNSNILPGQPMYITPNTNMQQHLTFTRPPINLQHHLPHNLPPSTPPNILSYPPPNINPNLPLNLPSNFRPQIPPNIPLNPTPQIPPNLHLNPTLHPPPNLHFNPPPRPPPNLHFNPPLHPPPNILFNPPPHLIQNSISSYNTAEKNQKSNNPVLISTKDIDSQFKNTKLPLSHVTTKNTDINENTNNIPQNIPPINSQINFSPYIADPNIYKIPPYSSQFQQPFHPQELQTINFYNNVPPPYPQQENFQSHIQLQNQETNFPFSKPLELNNIPISQSGIQGTLNNFHNQFLPQPRPYKKYFELPAGLMVKVLTDKIHKKYAPVSVEVLEDPQLILDIEKENVDKKKLLEGMINFYVDISKNFNEDYDAILSDLNKQIDVETNAGDQSCAKDLDEKDLHSENTSCKDLKNKYNDIENNNNSTQESSFKNNLSCDNNSNFNIGYTGWRPDFTKELSKILKKSLFDSKDDNKIRAITDNTLSEVSSSDESHTSNTDEEDISTENRSYLSKRKYKNKSQNIDNQSISFNRNNGTIENENNNILLKHDDSHSSESLVYKKQKLKTKEDFLKSDLNKNNQDSSSNLRKNVAIPYNYDNSRKPSDSNDNDHNINYINSLKNSPPSKSMELNTNNVGYKMLEKMGWQKGKGLGSTFEGITQPILASESQGLSGSNSSLFQAKNKSRAAAPADSVNHFGKNNKRMEANKNKTNNSSELEINHPPSSRESDQIYDKYRSELTKTYGRAYRKPYKK
ncbi:hypothetical protein BB561_005319 [Smittium simulii]|uniref:G-patch domain-containing protein n=1 Tax=Smittium simulii TaxID=133385 RepID=A0A2T9YAX3_9FUNG|nr:hypothetical protein BB561_005319 [Smittium simulii]